MNIIGELAGIFTSVCWSISAIAYTISGRQIGSQIVNRIRVLAAIIMLAAINWIFYGQPLPLQAGTGRWFWLLLSGVVGLAIGDAFLFQAYHLIGARMGLLLLSLAPVFSTLIAWLFMHETLTLIQIIGIVVTLFGISWVVVSHNKGQDESNDPNKIRLGILFGVFAAIGQAGGLALSRQGMAGNFPPFAGTLIRMIAAVISLWGLALFQKKVGVTFQKARQNPKMLWLVIFGSVFGPVVGVSLSLLAIQYAKLGVASTLMALPPVLMLPVSYFGFKERFGWQAIAGTVLSIVGVAVLFLK